MIQSRPTPPATRHPSPVTGHSVVLVGTESALPHAAWDPRVGTPRGVWEHMATVLALLFLLGQVELENLYLRLQLRYPLFQRFVLRLRCRQTLPDHRHQEDGLDQIKQPFHKGKPTK